MRTRYLILLFGFFISACNSNNLLQTENLPTQIFKIDPKKDTTFKTQNGAIIRIPKGALQADGGSIIQLEIREAYNISQMIHAGLLTQSNGQPLSSGGMIYINAAGENNVRIAKPISIAIPTSSLDPKMQLYTGNVDADGKINWTDPKPLPNNPQSNALAKGKKLFIRNCASCHALNKDLTGPSLAHILKRNAWMLHYPSAFHSKGLQLDTLSYRNLLYDYTRNNFEVLSSGHSYFSCLHKKYGRKPMPAFRHLTKDDLDSLYAYIESESELRNMPIPDNGIARCVDSCRLYRATKDSLEEIKSRLEKDSTDLGILSYEIPITATDSLDDLDDYPKSNFTDTLPMIEKVNPVKHRSLYYQFTIETFGWYNVDMAILEKDGIEESKLVVRIKGDYQERFDIYLVVPSIKLFVQGGKLESGEDLYGFHKPDGSIPLPQNTRAYIIAMGEHGNRIIFGTKEFTTVRKQNFDIFLRKVTKGFFDQQIRLISLDSVSIKVNETKTGRELREVIRKIEKAEELKPKNCDCDCIQPPPTNVPAPGAEGQDVLIKNDTTRIIR